MRAGQPCAVASDGITIHSSASTPTTPIAAPASRSHAWQAAGGTGGARCTSAADREAERLSEQSPPARGTARRPRPGSRGRSPPNAVTIVGHEADAERRRRRAMPAHDEDAGDEPEPPSADARRRGRAPGRRGRACSRARRGSRIARQQPAVGEEARVRDHAVVGPDRLALDVPGALQHLERLDHPERRRWRAPRAAGRPAGSSAGTRAGCRPAAAPFERVLHDAPRLGQVEQDAVEVVARRCRRRRRGPRPSSGTSVAEEPVHVAHRALRRSRRGSRSRCT